ncbi:MAG: AsmA family protein [Planctomycetota bacterium]
MKRWLRRLLIGLALAVAFTWLFGGHRLVEPSLRAELRESTGIEPTIGFVLVGPDLNLYAYDVRFEDERLSAHVPWAKFEIPVRKLWGSGRTRAVRVRQLKVRVKAQADLTGLGRAGRSGDDANHSPVAVKPPELICEELGIHLENDGGELRPLLLSDWLTAIPSSAREIEVELGAGQAGEFAFDGITTRVVPTRRHLLVSDFKMRAFGGLVDGMLDMHLGSAGRFNGELSWHLLEVERFCRHFELPYAEKRQGKLAGALRFEAASPRVSALKGSGSIRMERARFWSPVTFKVFGVLGLPQREESWVNRANVSFSIEKGLLYVEKGTVQGADYMLDVQGIFDLDGACDIEADHVGTTLAIRGKLDDPDVKVLPFNAVTVPFDRLYRERLDKK